MLSQSLFFPLRISASTKLYAILPFSPPHLLVQFASDGITLHVSEAAASRVTSWNASSGALVSSVRDLKYPLGIAACGAGLASGIAVAELKNDTCGEFSTY
jgi:hypothetical protein